MDSSECADSSIGSTRARAGSDRRPRARFAKETFPAAKNGSDELRGHIIQPRAKAWPALISNAFHNRRTSRLRPLQRAKGLQHSEALNAMLDQATNRAGAPNRTSATAPPTRAAHQHLRRCRHGGMHAGAGRTRRRRHHCRRSQSALSPRGLGRLRDAEHARHRPGRQAGLGSCS